MSIRKQTLAIILFTLVVAVTVFFFFNQVLLLREYEQLEQSHMSDRISAAKGAILGELQALSRSAALVAYDETFNALLRGDASNLSENAHAHSMFSALDIHFLSVTRENGTIAATLRIDPDADKFSIASADLVEHVEQWSTLTASGPTSDPRQGVALIDSTFTMVVSVPIFDGGGDSLLGYLTVGRMFDQETISRLEQILQLEIVLHPLAAELPIPIEAMSDDGAQFMPLSDTVIAGFTLMRDATGNPTGVLEILSSRDIFQQAKQTVTAFNVSIVVAGSIAGIWFALLMDRFILSRISRLKHDIETIRSQSRLDDRVVVRGKDELTALGKALNDLLGNLEITQEELTHARDEALQALETKNQLLANISHDARTPLSVIMLRAENLERGIYGPLTSRQREVLAGMKASANQMLFFVNNLLASAKLKTGMMQLASEPINVGNLLRDIRTLMEPLAADNSLKLMTETLVDPSFTPYGDSDRIKQIVFNLIDNAIKFSKPDGSITVCFAPDGESFWAISVADTGQGIPPNEKQHIFEAFYQVDPATTRGAVAGVGLGLSIVRQLTTLMEGTIDVQSEIGVGTTFRIVLPARAPRVETREMLAVHP